MYTLPNFTCSIPSLEIIFCIIFSNHEIIGCIYRHLSGLFICFLAKPNGKEPLTTHHIYFVFKAIAVTRR